MAFLRVQNYRSLLIKIGIFLAFLVFMVYRHHLAVVLASSWKTGLLAGHVNWTDVIVGTAILAIIPFVLAAYGGHLAAEMITEFSLRRRTKLTFWGLCLVGVVLAFYQQYRASQSDTEKDERTTFVQNLILTQLKGLHDQGTAPVPVMSNAAPRQPGKPTEAERRQNILKSLRSEYILSHNNIGSGLLAGTEQLPSDWVNGRLKELGESWTVADNSAIKPEVSLSMVDKKLPHLSVVNMSGVVANNPKYFIVLWNIDSDDKNPLAIPTVTMQDYINPRSAVGPNQFLEQVSNSYKDGDRLFGHIAVTCAGCPTKDYWVMVRVGDGGWYSLIGDDKYANNDALIRALPEIRKNLDDYTRDIPIESRVSILNR